MLPQGCRRRITHPLISRWQLVGAICQGHERVASQRRAGNQKPSHLVFLETEWVLRSRYKLGKSEILGAFSDLMSAADVNFEDEPAIEEALFTWKNSSAQFADCLIGARYGTLACSATATFDSDAPKLRGFVAA